MDIEIEVVPHTYERTNVCLTEVCSTCFLLLPADLLWVVLRAACIKITISGLNYCAVVYYMYNIIYRFWCGPHNTTWQAAGLDIPGI
jgi:hypothetical protein